MRLCSIASGSSGNSIYVGTDNTHILVDSGISGKKTETGLHELELSLKDINGILITHEHSDHISSLGILSRKCKVPIYGTRGTIEAVKKKKHLGKIDESLFRIIKGDEPFSIQDITIYPFNISHDAAEPVAFRMEHEKKKIAVATDIGCFNDYIITNLQGLDILFLEANHDVRMLQVGPYPYALKQRVLGNRGHLSNESSGRLLCSVLHDNLKQIILGHLSHENNLAELAYETVRVEVAMSDNRYIPEDFSILVANRSTNTQSIII